MLPKRTTSPFVFSSPRKQLAWQSFHIDICQSSPSPPLCFPDLSTSHCCFRWLPAVTSLRISWARRWLLGRPQGSPPPHSTAHALTRTTVRASGLSDFCEALIYFAYRNFPLVLLVSEHYPFQWRRSLSLLHPTCLPGVPSGLSPRSPGPLIMPALNCAYLMSISCSGPR